MQTMSEQIKNLKIEMISEIVTDIRKESNVIVLLVQRETNREKNIADRFIIGSGMNFSNDMRSMV